MLHQNKIRWIAITIPWIWDHSMPTKCEYSIKKHSVRFGWGDMRQSLGNIVRCLFVIGADQGQCWFILVPFLFRKFKNWLKLVIIYFYHSKKRFLLMHSIFSMSLHRPIVILWRPSFILVHCYIVQLSFFNCTTVSLYSYSIVFHDTLFCFLLCFIVVASRPIIICVIFLVLFQMV
jgi:hypothetical protein